MRGQKRRSAGKDVWPKFWNASLVMVECSGGVRRGDARTRPARGLTQQIDDGDETDDTHRKHAAIGGTHRCHGVHVAREQDGAADINVIRSA